MPPAKKTATQASASAGATRSSTTTAGPASQGNLGSSDDDEPNPKDAQIAALEAQVQALKGKAAEPIPIPADTSALDQTALLNLVNALVQQNTLLQAQPAPEKKKRKARPDPAKLSDGTDPTVEYWILDMKNKLQADEEDYPTDRDQVAYCITRTEGKAAKHLGPRVGAKSKNPLTTANEIFEFLETIFTDRLTKKKARRALTKLRFYPGNSFHEFITDFRIKAQEAEYDEEDWKELLESTLTDNMAQALAVQANDDKVDFEDFVEACSRYALTAEQRRGAGGRPSRTPTGASSSKKPSSADGGSSDSRTRRSTTPGVRPKYDDAGKQKLSDEGRCFNCGETGHMARACPRPKENTRATPAKEVRFQKKDLDSGSDTANESGKEEP